MSHKRICNYREGDIINDIKDVCVNIACTLDINLRDFYIVGGAIVSHLLGEETKDFDVILKIGTVIKTDQIPIKTKNFDSYEMTTKNGSSYDIQILKNREASNLIPIIDRLNHFDLVHTTIAYGYNEGLIGVKNKRGILKALACIQNKQLKIHKPVDNLATLYRCFKFTQRGWSILPSEQRKLVANLSSQDILKAQDTSNMDKDSL